ADPRGLGVPAARRAAGLRRAEGLAPPAARTRPAGPAAARLDGARARFGYARPWEDEDGGRRDGR
ncbi:RraA family protein, partial [Streptomyces sp. NPDC059409]